MEENGCFEITKIEGIPIEHNCKVWSVDKVKNELIVLESEREICIHVGAAGESSSSSNGSESDVADSQEQASIRSRRPDHLDVDEDEACVGKKIMYCFRYYKLPDGMYFTPNAGSKTKIDFMKEEPVSATSSPILPLFCSYAIINNRHSIMNARLSLDKTLLLLQISETIVVVAAIGERTTNPWILNVASPQGAIRGIPLDESHEFLLRRKNVSNQSGIHILSDGIIWSDHGGNSQDLILITNESVLFYKVSRSRNQFIKSRSYTHQIDRFWFDMKTRALVCGQLTSSNEAPSSTSGTAILLRTYFLRMPLDLNAKNSHIMTEKRSFVLIPTSLPRLRVELPPPEVLPIFIVGSLSSINRGLRRASVGDIHIVNLYRDTYLLDTGSISLGNFDIYLVDKEKCKITFISKMTLSLQVERGDRISLIALDDVLCIMTSNCTIAFYDIRTNTSCPIFYSSINKKCYRFFLQSSGLYTPPSNILFAHEISLLRLNLRCLATDHIVTGDGLRFLMKRGMVDVSKEIVLGQVRMIVHGNFSKGLIKDLVNDIVSLYVENMNIAYAWDLNIQSRLTMYASFLQPSSYMLPKFETDLENFSGSASASNVISQSDLLNVVLIPEAKEIMSDDLCFQESKSRARLISVVSFAELVKDYRRKCIDILRCPSFYNSSWDAYNAQCNMGIIILADALVQLGQKSINAPNANTNEAVDFKVAQRYTLTLVKQCTDILCSHSAHNLAATKLIEIGFVLEAINVCTIFMREQNKIDTPCKDGNVYSCSGTTAVKFFKAAIQCAKSIPSIVERIRLFYRLATFLHEWDKDSVCIPTKSGINIHMYVLYSVKKDMAAGSDDSTCSANNEHSPLSRTVMFPDYLFGGEETKESFTLRKLFGYPTPFFSFFGVDQLSS